MRREMFLLASAVVVWGALAFGPAMSAEPEGPGQGVIELQIGAGHEDLDLPRPVGAGQADPKAALNKVLAAVKTGPMVFIATVQEVRATMQALSYPPRTNMNVTVKDVTVLRGERPAGLTFSYLATEGRDFEPKVGQKVVAVAQAAPAGRPRPVPQQPQRPGVQPGGPVLRLGPPVGSLPRILAIAEATDENVAAVKKALGAIGVPDAPPDRPTTRVAGPGRWVRLFADEEWYKRQVGPERLFTGELKAIKVDPDMVTTLQRTSYYSLGPRTIYTGAKRLPALDALVGKVVTIRGKAVDMALEGQMVSEIWPAQVREAREPLHPIETHPEEPAPREGSTPPSTLPASGAEPIRPTIELDGTR